MHGMCEIAEDIFQMPVRLGLPVGAQGNGARGHGLTEGGFASVIAEPRYATGVGLVLHGARSEGLDRLVPTHSAAADRGPGLASRLFSRVREIF